ncbi:MAG TPA: hypothetical protein DCO83_16080 [Mucilaginibacter sp.]|jgi:amino acid permease|nr:hypothetical protein [Mucilaginibacter sp.]
MAHLEVKPKSSKWWLWLIIVIIIIAVAAFCYQRYYRGAATVTKTDSTKTTITDSEAARRAN